MDNPKSKIQNVLSTKKPPRSLSKQKSCGSILHNYQGREKNEMANRGCLTPTPKTTAYQRNVNSATTGSRSDLIKSKDISDSGKKLTRSCSRKTPLASKYCALGATSQYSKVSSSRTPGAVTRTPLSSYGHFKGKTKRDSDKQKDDPRPLKRLATSREEITKQNLSTNKGSFDIQKGIESNRDVVPVAEVKPMPVVRSLYLGENDMQDGPTNEKSHKAEPSASYDSVFGQDENMIQFEKQKNSLRCNSISGDFSVHVAVRVRPFTQREQQCKDITSVVEMHENSVNVTECNGNPHIFTYDMAFWSCEKHNSRFASQETVYKETAQPLLKGVLEGYNTCLFAYGQTGSGKSYTMTGYEGDDAGIIPRFCEELFERINKDYKINFAVEISFFEIYNERIRDLLTYSQDNTKQLRIREHPEEGPYVQDLSIFTVTCWEDIEGWLAIGNKNRATAATGMNDRSSRSHSVFTILLSQSKTEFFEDTETNLSRSSKVNLIDLAGSERANQVITEELAADYEAANSRLKEGSCINRSLHTLGKVISLLSEKQTGPKKKLFIPYRDSTLTWLLKESLGGNSRTAMIATISPASTHIAETLSTLRYARQARNIVNQVRVNEDVNAKMIRELLREIARLKSVQPDVKDGCFEPASDEVEQLKSKLVEANAMLSKATKEWEQKLKLSEIRWKEETEKIKQSGITSHIDNSLPCLVNLNEDPMLSEILVYLLKDGNTTVGNSLSQGSYDIKLNGPLVADYHCCITNDNQQVKISPIRDALVYVNGEQISANGTLKHGDRIVIGGSHFFRFNHPLINSSAAKSLTKKPSKRELRKKWDGLTLKDFEFAKRELAQQQNAKLEAELEESHVKAQEGLIDLITSAKENAEKQLSLQRDAYKEEIAELQKRLEEAECKRKVAENNQNIAEDKLAELNSKKMALEEEIQGSRKRLHDEALAAKQVFDQTKASQLEIIAELEKEKRKMEDDVNNFKNKKLQRTLVRTEIRSALTSAVGEGSTGKKDLLKIALLLREANKISEKLGRNITFSRDDILENEQVEIRIRLNDTKHGRTTLWSLEKFEIMVRKMRDLYQANGKLDEGEEDPFCDSMDEWMDDFILDSPTTPQPNLNGSRMSIGRRFSLNHSLNLLTNLNASLSELSKRRKSSFIGSTNKEKDSSKIQHQPAPLIDIYDFIGKETCNETGQTTCKRLLNVAEEVRDSLQNAPAPTSMTAHKAAHIAVLLARLKEGGDSWSRMQKIFGCPTAEMHISNVKRDISILIKECKILFQEKENIRGSSSQSISKILDTLKKIVEDTGEASLVAADFFDDTLNGFMSKLEPNFHRPFIHGNCSIWSYLAGRWVTMVDESLQELRNLQLCTTQTTDIDLDDVGNFLNSTLTMAQNLKEFMECVFDNQNEEEINLLVSGKSLLIQRHIIGNMSKLTDKTRSFVLITKQKRGMINEDASSLHDLLHCIMKHCKKILNLCAAFAEFFSSNDERIGQENPSIKSRLEKLDFSMKAVQVGVAVISQNLEDICFPAGDYSICLDNETDGGCVTICSEAVICPLSLRDSHNCV